MTLVEEVARRAAELSIDGIPSEVLALCRAQRASVLGGVAASAGDAASRRVLNAVTTWARPGPAPLVAGDSSVTVEDAVYAATALSVALDFDDYMCFGHTGHSAVLVPALLAAETGSSGHEQLVAQAAANEVEARLGGACLIGPLNGQLWSFIHAAGSALAAGRLLGLDHHRLAHALALSLYQAPRPTVPGFMAPDSKLLTVSESALIGLRAARLAAAGVTGPLDVLDHPQGFLAAFSYAPLPGLLGGLGEAWATKTLCVKPYPGCAYVDTILDALLDLDLPPANEVDRVLVDASMLTCEMDRWSANYSLPRHHTPTPVTINFSVAWNVAIALLARAVSPRQLRADWLGSNQEKLAELAGRVALRHDWELTRQATEHFAGLLPPRALGRDASVMKLASGLARVGSDHGSLASRLSRLRGAGAMVRTNRGSRARSWGRSYWSPSALDDFQMTFPARVTVILRDGRRLEGSADAPRGGAGHTGQGPAAVGEAKLNDWGPELWGDEGTKAIHEAIATDHDRLFACLAH